MLSLTKSQFLYKPKNIETREMQVQEEKSNQNEKIKLSQILKNATERQCFGQFMKFSKTTAPGEHSETMSSRAVHEVCANGLLMLKAGVTNESMTFSLYGYVTDDADILKVYETLGIDPYYRIKCSRTLIAILLLRIAIQIVGSSRIIERL
jgi:hypothetical protein